MNHVVFTQDADRDGPLKHGERLVERAADGVVVRDEPGRFASAQKEMRQRIRAIFERASLARSCGNRHCDIITQAPTHS